MASVEIDSELMRQHVAAVPVPNSSEFFTVRDERGLAMLFSLGNNGALYAFKENDSGARILIDMNQAFGIADKEVLTFAVVQDTQDQIYYCFAYEEGTDSDRGQTTLAVCRPFRASVIDVESPNLDLRHLRIPETGNSNTRVSKIFLGPKHPRQSYPAVMLGYVPLGQVRHSADLARVAVDSTLASWSLKSDVELPENATQVIDLCPAALPVGSGYFVLYVIQGVNQLVFTTTPNAAGFSWKVALDPPAGSRCLAAVQQSSGYSGLVVGGAGLYYWSPQEAQQRNHPGRRLLSGDDQAVDGVVQIHVAQAPSLVSLFVSSSNAQVSYATTPYADFTRPIDPVPLLKNAGSFSPFIARDGSTQQLIVSSGGGSLSLLHQDSVTGHWKTLPFYIPSLDENIEFDAYMTRISILMANKEKLIQETLLLKSPEGWTDILVNGRNVTVGPDGTPVLTDMCGTLTLVIPSDDISSFQFVLADAGGGFPAHLGGDVAVDPTTKVTAKLHTIKSGKDIRDATLENGTKLLADSDASNEEIDAAADAIVTLNEQRAHIASANLCGQSLRKRHPHRFTPGKVRTGKDLGPVLAGVKEKRVLNARKIVDRDWNIWHYIWREIKRIGSFIVEKVVDGIVVVIELAGEFIRLVVRSLDELAKVMSMIWDKVLNAWEKFKEWVSFIFNWEDIVDAKDSIKKLVNNVFDTIPGALDALSADAVALLDDDITATAEGAIGRNEVSNTKGGKDSMNEPMTTTGKESMNSASTQYVSYQLDHGGAAAHTAPANGVAPKTVETTPLGDVFSDRAGSTVDNANNIKDNLFSLFEAKGNVSGAEIAQNLTSGVLNSLIDALKAVIISGAAAMRDFIKAFRAVANQAVHIPVFSALYKKITGSELTLLDGICLIIAIPSTVMVKVASGKKFPDLGTLDITQAFARSPFGRGRALQRRKGDDDAWRPSLDVNFGMSIVECIVRMLRAVLSAFDMGDFKDKFGRRTTSEAVELLRFDMQAESGFSEKQVFQLRKFASAHPLASARTAVGRRAGPIRRQSFDKLLALVGLGMTLPLDFTATRVGMRWASWICALLAEGASIASAGPIKKTTITIANFIFVIIVSVSELNDDDDTANWSSGSHIAQSIIDLLSSLSGIVADETKDWKIKAASFGLDAVSCGFLVGLTIASRAEDRWNYILCDV